MENLTASKMKILAWRDGGELTYNNELSSLKEAFFEICKRIETDSEEDLKEKGFSYMVELLIDINKERIILFKISGKRILQMKKANIKFSTLENSVF